MKYQKKATTIEAEQFNGSASMIKKYGLSQQLGVFPYTLYFEDNEYQMETDSGIATFEVGDWIATTSEGEHYPIANDYFRKNYVEGNSETFEFTLDDYANEISRQMKAKITDELGTEKWSPEIQKIFNQTIDNGEPNTTQLERDKVIKKVLENSVRCEVEEYWELLGPMLQVLQMVGGEDK